MSEFKKVNFDRRLIVTYKTLEQGGLALYITVNTENFNDSISIPNEIDNEPVREFHIRPLGDTVFSAINIPKCVERADFQAPYKNSNNNIVCYNDCAININPKNPYIFCKDKIIYSKTNKSLVKALYSCPERIEVPRGIERIESEAFRANLKIKEVVLPPETRFIGDSAFYCSGLEKINLENVREIGESAFCYSKLTSVKLTCPTVNGFMYCRLSSVILENTKTIADSAFFGNDMLTQIDLPEGLIEIGNGAFAGCDLWELSLPKSVRSLGSFEPPRINVYLTDHFPLALNDYISIPIGRIFTVLSPETDEVLFSIVNFEEFINDDYDELDMGGHYPKYDYICHDGINFTIYDKTFTEYGRNTLKDIFIMYTAARYRLDYPVDLTEEMRSVYERFPREHAAELMKFYVSETEDIELFTGLISEFEYMDDICDRDFSEIIRLAAERGVPEITALILEKRHSCRKNEENDL